MACLLHIDSSPMGDGSISRRLTREFARQWRLENPGCEVIYRDLAATAIAVVDAAWVAANYAEPATRSPEQHRHLALSTELAGELLAADEIVIGVPLHNWGPAASFKLWADQIVRFGLTLRITSAGMAGALQDKRLTVFETAGRRYGAGSEDAGKNHLEPWLRTFFGNLGLRKMRFVFVDGTAAIRNGKVDQTSFLTPHLQSVEQLFADAELSR